MFFTLRKKRNIGNFAGGIISIKCNFTTIIITKINGVQSFVNSNCSVISKKIIKNFVVKSANVNSKKIIDVNFRKKFVLIDSDKRTLSNFNTKNDSITVTKQTIIT